MQPINFFYWIQGYFELVELVHRDLNARDEPNPSILSYTQFECVLRHIALVEATVGNDNLPGRLIAIKALADRVDRDNLELMTLTIRGIVHDQFAHVIDKIDPPEKQQELNEIHSPAPVNKPKPSLQTNPFDKPMMRC
jgi:hypothetical protein